jgi:hypothetical protein
MTELTGKTEFKNKAATVRNIDNNIQIRLYVKKHCNTGNQRRT